MLLSAASDDVCCSLDDKGAFSEEGNTLVRAVGGGTGWGTSAEEGRALSGGGTG